MRPPRKSASAPTTRQPRNAAAAGRQRKWHPRVFTGCLNCRKRHVKCDEQTPSCAKCARLNLHCTFSRTFVPLAVDHNVANNKTPATTLIMAGQGGGGPDMAGASSDDLDGVFDRAVPLPDEPPQSSFSQAVPTTDGMDVPSFQLCLPAQVQGDQNTMYYQHYLFTVSPLLIIFDTPCNSNPYRMLLSLVGDENSTLLQSTMEALGAMHLASVPQTEKRSGHRAAAIKLYANVVSRLRQALLSLDGQAASLELLAICLLLCMYEKMSATDASWKVHLRGASQIAQAMYSPGLTVANRNKSSALTLGSDNLPIRRFLVSLLSYLDVAASCATGEAPFIAGDYWETLGGGWQYNLGVPDFAASHCTANRELAQVRSAWSRLMSIQAEISSFAKLQRSGLDKQQKDAIHVDLVYRLKNWHDSAPNVFLQLENLNELPFDAKDSEIEILTVTACVESYAEACAIYLDRIASKRLQRAADDDDVKSAVDRVFTLTLNFSHGISQLAVVWPLLTAGIATVDQQQQELCRQKLNGMRNFGFKHVSRALETLEYCWRHVERYDNVDYDEFEAMLSSNLVP
ncbi:hypothetical protein BB8028_0003g00280 [Beauveria bassiana]|uniref:Zn(2)-C6 fungal-type domain-containing protein n=1 Tax=Beauveria bassiana TaxID=176275 RepID=A0A2S7Y6B3_BEABA|nr:hypothetical protein BB8028_0003g00280 [Beauveria bassiana]